MKNKRNLVSALTLFALILSSCSLSAQPATPYPTPSGATPSAAGTQTGALLPAIPSSSGSPTSIPSTGSAGLLAPQYYYPLQNSDYVSKDATIILRYGPVISEQIAASLKVALRGTKSGNHAGQIKLADDQKTIIFTPDQPFTPGEQVRVEIGSLSLGAQTTYRPLAYTFTVAVDQQQGSPASTAVPLTYPQSAFPNYLTLPQDIPHYTVSKTSPDTGEGYIFVAPYYWQASTIGSYLLILDNQGQIVYYQSMANQLAGFDFKLLPNGMLSYYEQKNSDIVWMNNSYQVANTYQAGTGYVADLHDSLLLPNGNLILMVNDIELVDMSKVVPGGKSNASVYGLVIQELDPSKNVIWVWRSWDHFSYSDSTADLTTQGVDLIHGNGLALANDGNLLLSSRNLSEITKINLQTGDIIWRLGGKANQFTFLNDQGFAFQHNINQLPNGDITLFDNHGTDQNPAPSRGVEYSVDEANKTVTKVWEYTHVPPVFTDYMGDVQRLTDGNTFMGWGDAVSASGYVRSSMMELSPDNQTLFELTFDSPYVSYRAFRAPWQGFPLTKPALAFKVGTGSLTLGYSWNGATEVVAWLVYGGTSPQSLHVIEEKAKNGFETQSILTNLPAGECYFQAAALDQSGQEMARSLLISTDTTICPLAP
ncbi:MAG: aryl-sulfate sulfotransferase [Chloroflexi bacterium]|nr:aryl-sulfate sulfotransferase [Chloroflexota bacterium]